MFKNLQETIKELNADVKNVTNCEKAKRLRKKLLAIGLPLAIGGILGVFIGFALFTTAGFGASFLLAFPCGVVGVIGINIASLGFEIVITGYTTNLINETVGNNCPNCGETIGSEMLFCSKCGTKVRKECPNCKYVNNHKSVYCEKCGTKLN